LRSVIQVASNGRGLPSRHGLTILELLIVVATIATLISLVLPGIQAAREGSRNLQCVSNLHQIGIALHEFQNGNRVLPAGWKLEVSEQTSYGWAAAILIDLELGNLDTSIDRNRPLFELNSNVLKQTPEAFLCPSDPGEPTFSLYTEEGDHESNGQASTEVLIELPRANYIGVFGTLDPDAVQGDRGQGMFVQNRGRRLSEISRGLSHVVFVGERTTRKLPSTWLGIATDGEDAAGRIVGYNDLGPNRDDADECEFDSRHSGHVNFLWVDGHVSSVADDVDRNVYRQFAERN
jgi:prepilin-type processing-associated H-X9-DG protein